MADGLQMSPSYTGMKARVDAMTRQEFDDPI